MRKAIVTYIPVLHEGYRKLFLNHPDASEVFLFGEDVISSFPHLIKDIRKLDPELVKKALESWGMHASVRILDSTTIHELQANKVNLVISDDDITTALVAQYFSQNPLTVDSIFLRWHKKTSVEPVQVSPDVRISTDAFDKEMIALAREEGDKSPDWWRRIGSLAVKDGKILFTAHNTYLPSDLTPYDEGDPRANFTTGVNLESSLAIHAEAYIVAMAAKEGVSLAGADVYAETFPCPPCAKQLAVAGIKRLFYHTGYKILDGERILRSFGVEIIFVE